MKIHVAAVEVLRKKKREDENQFTTMEKLIWVPVISFCKISFPLMHLMTYYAETGLSSPPNRLPDFMDIFIVYANVCW